MWAFPMIKSCPIHHPSNSSLDDFRFFKWVNRCTINYIPLTQPDPWCRHVFCSNHHISWWTFFVPISPDAVHLGSQGESGASAGEGPNPTTQISIPGLARWVASMNFYDVCVWKQRIYTTFEMHVFCIFLWGTYGKIKDKIGWSMINHQNFGISHVRTNPEFDVFGNKNPTCPGILLPPTNSTESHQVLAASPGFFCFFLLSKTTNTKTLRSKTLKPKTLNPK